MLYESGRLGHGDRFGSLKKYWEIIVSEAPDLLLIAGDVTGDGSCGHGFHTAFFYLLSLAELSKLTTCFLQGDNDIEKYYSSVTTNLSQFSYVKEISDRHITIKGLNILGVPFETTAQKKLLNKMLEKYSATDLDLILCHSPLKRRTFLLNMNFRYLVTGHFDNKLLPINDKVFISLSNDSAVINYTTISLGSNKEIVHYKFCNPYRRMLIDYSLIKSNPNKTAPFDDSLEVNGIPVPIEEYENMKLPRSAYEMEKNALALSIKYLRGKAYNRSISFMNEVKTRNIEASKKVLKEKMKENITAKHKLSKSMLLDYLGSQVRAHLFN